MFQNIKIGWAFIGEECARIGILKYNMKANQILIENKVMNK